MPATTTTRKGVKLTTGTTTITSELPDYAPVPQSALGPALNEQGYYVDRVEREPLLDHRRHLPVGVPDHYGRRRRARRAADDRQQHPAAIDEIAAANGVSNKVTPSHLLAPPTPTTSARPRCSTRTLRASGTRTPGGSCFATTTLRGLRTKRPSANRRTLEIGGERIDLAWHGANHSPDNIIIHLLPRSRRADADRHRQPGLGAGLSLQPDRRTSPATSRRRRTRSPTRGST